MKLVDMLRRQFPFLWCSVLAGSNVIMGYSAFETKNQLLYSYVYRIVPGYYLLLCTMEAIKLAMYVGV